MDQTTDRKLIVGRRVDQKRGAIHLAFTGNWHTEADDKRFKDVMDDTLARYEGVAGRYLVFELTFMPVIYGVGVEELVKYHLVVERRRGLMILINPSERVQRELIQRFHGNWNSYFTVVASEEEAARKIDEHRQMTADATTVQVEGP